MFDCIARAREWVRLIFVSGGDARRGAFAVQRVPERTARGWHSALPAWVEEGGAPEAPLMPAAPKRAGGAGVTVRISPVSPVKPWASGLPEGGPEDDTLIDADLSPVVRLYVMGEAEQWQEREGRRQRKRRRATLIAARNGG